MPNKIRISISYNDKVHKFIFSHWLKKIFLALVVILFFLLMGSFSYLKYESSQSEASVKNMIIRNSAQADELESLNRERLQLERVILDKEEEHAHFIEQKNTELSVLNRRVSTVEELMGLEKEENLNASLTERLDVAAINSAVRSIMLQLIPNGKAIESFRNSSGYGMRTHPITGARTFHLGLDLTANVGTPVLAAADGVVEQKRSSPKGYGNMIRVRHSFGFTTLYGHLSKFNINVGQFVKKGEIIGWSGNTGLSTGPHLHYEVRFLDKALDPRRFIAWGPENFDAIFVDEKKVNWKQLVNVITNMASDQVKLSSLITDIQDDDPTAKSQPETYTKVGS